MNRIFRRRTPQPPNGLYVVFYSTQLLKHTYMEVHTRSTTQKKLSHRSDAYHGPDKDYIFLRPLPLGSPHTVTVARQQICAATNSTPEDLLYPVHTHHPATTPATILTNLATCIRRYTTHANRPHDISANKLMDAYAWPLRYLHACP